MSFSSISSTEKSLYPKSIRIGLVDPNIAQTWAQRILSDGTTVASIKKGDTINHTTSQPIATGLFCQRIFGPCIDYTCACGHEKIRIHRNVNVSPPVCPECHVEWTESSVRRQRLGSIELISPVTHKWFSDSRNYIPILSGITVKTFKGLKECKLFFPFPFHTVEPKKKVSEKITLGVTTTQNQAIDQTILSFLQNNRTNQILQFLGHQSNLNRSLNIKDTYLLNKKTLKTQIWSRDFIPQGGTTYNKSGTWSKTAPTSKLESLAAVLSKASKKSPRTTGIACLLAEHSKAKHSAFKSAENFYTCINTLEILKKKLNKNSFFFNPAITKKKQNLSNLEDKRVDFGEPQGLGLLQTWPYVQISVGGNNSGSDRLSSIPLVSHKTQNLTSPRDQNSSSMDQSETQGSWVLPSTAPSWWLSRAGTACYACCACEAQHAQQATSRLEAQVVPKVPASSGSPLDSNKVVTSWSQRKEAITELSGGLGSTKSPSSTGLRLGFSGLQSHHQEGDLLGSANSVRGQAKPLTHNQSSAKTLSTGHHIVTNATKGFSTNSLLEFKTTSSHVKKNIQKKIARYRFIALNKTNMGNLAFLGSNSIYTMPVSKKQTNSLLQEEIRGVSDKSIVSFSQSPVTPLNFEYIVTLSEKNNKIYSFQSLKKKGKAQFLQNFKPVKKNRCWHDNLLLKKDNKNHSFSTLWPKKQNILTTLKKIYGLAFKWSKTTPTSLTEITRTKSESIAWVWWCALGANQSRLADGLSWRAAQEGPPSWWRQSPLEVVPSMQCMRCFACTASKSLLYYFGASSLRNQEGSTRLQNLPLNNSNWEFDYLPTILLVEKAKRIDSILATVKGQIDIIQKFKYLGELKTFPKRIGSLPYGYNPLVKPLVSVIPPWSPKNRPLVAVSSVRQFRRFHPVSVARIDSIDVKNRDSSDVVPFLRTKSLLSQQVSTTSSFVQSAAVNTIATLKALRLTNVQLKAVVDNQTSLLCGNLNSAFKNLKNRQFDLNLPSTCDLSFLSMVEKESTQTFGQRPQEPLTLFKATDFTMKGKQEPSATANSIQRDNPSSFNSNLTSNLFQKSSKIIPFEIMEVTDQRSLSHNPLWSHRSGHSKTLISKKETNWYKHHSFPIRPSFTQPEDYRRQFIKFLGSNGLISQGDTPIFKYITQNSNLNNYKIKKKVTNPSGSQGDKAPKEVVPMLCYASKAPTSAVVLSALGATKDAKQHVQGGSSMDVYFSEAKSFAKEDRVKHILTQTGGGALQNFLEFTNLNHCVLLLQNDLFEIAPRLHRSQSARRVLLQILNDTFNELNQTNRLLEKNKISSSDPVDSLLSSLVLKVPSSTSNRNHLTKEWFGEKSPPQKYVDSSLLPFLQSTCLLAEHSTAQQAPLDPEGAVVLPKSPSLELRDKVDISNTGVLSKAPKGRFTLLSKQEEIVIDGTGAYSAQQSINSEKSTQDKYKTYYRSKIEVLETKYKDLKKEYKAVKKICTDFQNRKNVQKRRYKLAFQLLRTLSNPAGMTLSSVPVLPPGLRPIIDVPKIGPITADLNIRYRGLIFALRNLRELAYVDFRNTGAAQASVQEAVDDLLYTGGKTRKDKAIDRSPNLYKSLAMRLKGKHGRFRGNLLGKRVDYSGRSVIVVGPTLKIHQCGLPFEIATKLFNPFLIRRLIQKGLCKNVYKAKQILISGKFKPLIWTLCREVMLEHLVLLNRAPTLHRLGVQAFMPILISGRAILLHPLVCTGFNADFDGDQMGVHIPLFPKARAEAWKMMWSRNNFLAPSSGEPILLPSQDMVLGCYYLTEMCLGVKPSLSFRNFYKNKKNGIMVGQGAHTGVGYGPLALSSALVSTGNKKDENSYEVSHNNRDLSSALVGALLTKPLRSTTGTKLQRSQVAVHAVRAVHAVHAVQSMHSMQSMHSKTNIKKSQAKSKAYSLWSSWQHSSQVEGTSLITRSRDIRGTNHPKVFLDAYNRGILNLQSIVWVNSYKIRDTYQSAEIEPSRNSTRFSNPLNEKLDGDGTLIPTVELRVTPYGSTQLLQTVGTKKGFFLNLILVPLKKKITTPFENASVRTTVGRLLFNNVLQTVERSN